MQRLLAILLVMLLAITAACGGDGDDEGDGDAADAPTQTQTTGDATEATGGDDEDDAGEDEGDDAGEDEGDDEGDGNGGGEGDPAAGEEIAQAQCVSCHSTDGSTIVGPTWQGLFGSEVELESGETVTADEEYIRESITDPSAKIHAGFSDIMPDLDLSEEQVNDLIAYIRTLE